MKPLTALFLAGALAVLASTPAFAQELSSCRTCHDKLTGAAKVSEQDSMHSRNGIECADCHGGDPKAADQAGAHSPAAGYRGKIGRAAVPELCGDCHADVRRMNPYGLPTDQLARYRTSRHGEALFGKADPDVATCIDCHGAHDISDIHSAGSPVHPKNVPATCGRCHSDEARMQKHGLPTNQEANYRQSVHAHLLFDKDDLSAPTCVTCHGNHGAVPPGVAKVELVCGKCHLKQKELFDLGPHAKPAREGQIEACVTCHSNHKVVPADPGLFRVCTLCHNEGEPAFERAKKVHDLLTREQKTYDDARAGLDAATKAGFGTDDEQVMMADAKTQLMQLAPLQHQMDLAKLQEVSGAIDKSAADVGARLEAKQKAARMRKLALVPLAGFMALMSIGFWLKKRSLKGGPK